MQQQAVLAALSQDFHSRVSKSSFLRSVIKVIIYVVVYWYGHLHRFSLRVGCKRDP